MKAHVVTGGAGFLGSHLCDALLEQGHTVVCIDNLAGTGGSERNIQHLFEHKNFEFVNADIVDWAKRGNLDGVDTVFHQAASKMVVSLDNPELDLQVNALGTQRLLLAAGAAGVRKFVYGSTGSVYGDSAGVLLTEESPTVPVSLYGATKLLAENYTRVLGQRFGLDWTILRYFHIIGPRQDSSAKGGVVPIFLRQLLQKEPITIFGSGTQMRNFSAVHDVVTANILVSSDARASGETYNCASEISVSINELADYCQALFDEKVEILQGPPRFGDVQRFNIDCQKIKGLGATFDSAWPALVRETLSDMRLRGGL